MAAREHLSSNPVPVTPVRRQRGVEKAGAEFLGEGRGASGADSETSSSGEWVDTSEGMSDF